jgi:hypothetical protein
MVFATQRQDLLEKARMALLRLNPPSYGFADAALTEVYVALQVISVIAKVHPKNYRKRVAKVLQEFFKDIRTPRMRQTDNQGCYNSALIAKLINDNLFHVDEFWLDEECMDFGTDNTVQIEWMGYRISWDEYDEMLQRLDELTRAGSFTIMMGILWGNVDATRSKKFGISATKHISGIFQPYRKSRTIVISMSVSSRGVLGNTVSSHWPPW